MRFLIRSILDTINGNNEDFSLHLLKGVPRMFFFFFFFYLQWKGVPQRRESLISFDALIICLKRLLALLPNTLQTDGWSSNKK